MFVCFFTAVTPNFEFSTKGKTMSSKYAHNTFYVNEHTANKKQTSFQNKHFLIPGNLKQIYPQKTRHRFFNWTPNHVYEYNIHI